MIDLQALVARPGANDLSFEDPALPGRPMILHSARPVRYSARTPVLFVHHGVRRNGDDYRDYWLPLVDEADVLVVAPEFPEQGFPAARWYNFGNRIDDEGRPQSQGESPFGLDGRLFALLRGQGITEVEGYGLFGHSAGGQFVQRAVSLGFRENVVAATCANAGSYAMPELDAPFPMGLGEIGLDADALGALLAFPLAVMVGEKDNDAASENLPRNPAALRQGATRYARAHNFYEAGQAAARRLNRPFAWSIADVPDVAHDGERMSAAAAARLSAALHAASSAHASKL